MTGTVADLEAELDALYGREPDAFVAARDDLVRRLRAAGRRDDVASVKRLRRPTVAAWALNQLSRRRKEEVQRLIQHGEELRRVQEELLAGRGRDQLRGATSARRAALDELADATLALLSEGGRTGAEAHRDDVLSTLEAASLEPEAGAAMLQGRLATGLAPTAGFDLLGAPPGAASGRQDVRAAPEPGTRPSAESAAVDAAAHEARLAEARQVAADARDLAERRRTEAGEVAETAARARRLAREADREVERLARELEHARRAAARAASALDDAESRLADAERVADKAERQAAAAEASLDRLEGD